MQLTASGGESYNWSGPNGFASTEQNPIIPNIQTGATGLYTVVVSSAGCNSEAQAAVVVNAVSASTTVVDETCHDCDDGSATAFGSGAASYTYLWSNGATGQTITGLAPGTYTVTITGNNGCTAIATAMVTPFGCPAIASEINLIAPLCFGDLGTVTIDPAGGTAPYD
ncbi:hypothetical protein RZS08_23220, partial [Arthrospira platensis SPKY1]|nr:hypothetical protein [Arthrospira platensis SPKY1]